MRLLRKIVAVIGALLIVPAAFAGGAVLVSLERSPTLTASAALAFDPSAIVAKAAVVYDLKTGDILYQKDAQEPLPLASLTKLITLQTALSQKDLGVPVTITAQDLAPEGDWGLHVGDTLTLHDLVALALVASCNDCAEAVANGLGSGAVGDINAQAKDLNLTRSSFSNPTGLDTNVATGQAGAYGSAFDVARLMGAFYQAHPELLALTQEPTISVPDGARTLTFPATMAPLRDIPGFIGAKTGYTDLAGGNLAAVFDLDVGHPVVVVVLHSTEEGRFSDVRALITSLRQNSAPADGAQLINRQ